MNNKLTIFNNVNNQEELSYFHGKEIEIIGILANPEDLSVIDWVGMPSYHIKLVETGEITSAYLDEVEDDFFMPEMEAVLAGMNAHLRGDDFVPLCYLYPQQYADGIKLSAIKNSDTLSHSINMLIEGWRSKNEELSLISKQLNSELIPLVDKLISQNMLNDVSEIMTKLPSCPTRMILAGKMQQAIIGQ